MMIYETLLNFVNQVYINKKTLQDSIYLLKRLKGVKLSINSVKKIMTYIDANYAKFSKIKIYNIIIKYHLDHGNKNHFYKLYVHKTKLLKDILKEKEDVK